MAELRFDGRVIVVTGAGAGLGRSYAHEFASRGAKVVVNDLGGTRHGDGSSSSAADIVVEEIRRSGGTAVADYNSVVDGDKVIKTALDHFGRIDVVINNAGILRDKSFSRVSDQDWDLIHQVHLKGSFKTAQAAFPFMKKQGYGRIIMTSSTAGLFGNFGQANYSAAKMGLVGLAKAIAIEGAKNNVFCNVIVPTAGSRLTEDIFPPEIFQQLRPEFIAPVVAYLCHESCKENGAIVGASGGWVGNFAIASAKGALLRSSIEDKVSVEKVRDNWAKITDISNPVFQQSIQEATMDIMEFLNQLKSGSNKDCQIATDSFQFNNKDVILYALGVGASLAKGSDELKYLYESHEEFSALPSFFILPALQVLLTSAEISKAIPGKEVNLTQILHGEQYLEIVKEMPLEGQLFQKVEIAEVLDKTSGASVVVNVDSFDTNNNLIVRNQIVVFAVGAGNFGGPRNGTKLISCQNKPSRKPDLSLTQKTSAEQAALYRLSGDLNPLHIDPNMALISGFDTPILHGMCTLGFSLRLILRAYTGHDVSLFKSLKVRFTKPVIPGQTLRVDTWKEGNRIHFETVVVETNQVVISGAYVDFKSIKMTPSANKLAASGLKSDAIFEYIIEQVKADPNKAKSVGGIFLYKVTKDGKVVKQWTMDLKNAKVYEGEPESKPNTTLTVSDEDMLLLSEGKLQPQQAFMKGKLKITGNIMMAQKLTPLLKANSKL
ncbi:peroxisomal multifunctional enzyme type 2-like isoform X1 [Euwallacea similis]|uniref:peroxisomal multifunctional enzyme type 2-like isoform X1 n=2 Tax=Euwallacea similis TaxID=1736056 RepID=UPI003450F909